MRGHMPYHAPYRPQTRRSRIRRRAEILIEFAVAISDSVEEVKYEEALEAAEEMPFHLEKLREDLEAAR